MRGTASDKKQRQSRRSDEVPDIVKDPDVKDVPQLTLFQQIAKCHGHGIAGKKFATLKYNQNDRDGKYDRADRFSDGRRSG